jgi:flagellar protein FliL
MATKAAAAPPAAAPEAAHAGDAVPVKKGKKKLLIIVGAVVLVLAIAGGGAAVYFKKKAAAAAEQEEAQSTDQAAEAAHPKVDLNHPPVFVPLDPFTVNLADKDSDRYAQIAVTLQVEDAKFAEKMKAFMPAIRNSILMVLAHKTSHELLERTGKEALAQEIMREAARPMGIYVGDAAHEPTGKTEEQKDEGEKKGKKAKPAAEPVVNPIQQVHFANFIIQ